MEYLGRVKSKTQNSFSGLSVAIQAASHLFMFKSGTRLVSVPTTKLLPRRTHSKSTKTQRRVQNKPFEDVPALPRPFVPRHITDPPDGHSDGAPLETLWSDPAPHLHQLTVLGAQTVVDDVTRGAVGG